MLFLTEKSLSSCHWNYATWAALSVSVYSLCVLDSSWLSLAESANFLCVTSNTNFSKKAIFAVEIVESTCHPMKVERPKASQQMELGGVANRF